MKRKNLQICMQKLILTKQDEWMHLLRKNENTGKPLQLKCTQDFWDHLEEMIEGQLKMMIKLLSSAAKQNRPDDKRIKIQQEDLEMIEDLMRRMIAKK